MSAWNKLWLRDTVERTLATYVQAFIGLLLASAATSWDIATVKAAAVAAVPAALAVVKAAIARNVPGTVSPASLIEG
jgi:hypothetical protein